MRINLIRFYYFVKRKQIGSSKYIKTVKNIRVKVLVFYNVIPTFLFSSWIFIAMGRDVIQFYKLKQAIYPHFKLNYKETKRTESYPWGNSDLTAPYYTLLV